MKYRGIITVFLLGAILMGAAAPARAAEVPVGSAAVQTAALGISSYKGSALSVGDRSMIMVSPCGASVTAASENPDVIALEQVLNYYVMVAKAPGTAQITIIDDTGNTASMTLTVGGTASPAESSGGAEAAADSSSAVSGDLTDNMDIRLKMVEYINQVRRENGKAKLPVEDSLMNAAQDVSSQCQTKHRPYDHMALIRYGWPHAGMYNLTAPVVYDCPDIAWEAVKNWVNSSGHLQTLLMDEASCVGTGVTIDGGRAYCYMVVGDPTGHNPYE